MYEVGFFYPRSSHWVALVRKSELSEAIDAAKQISEDATALPGVQVCVGEQDRGSVKLIFTVRGRQVVENEEQSPVVSPEAA